MKEISRLNYWIQRAIPFVYDDTLSLYELVAKTVAYLNNVIESQNDLSKEMAEFIDKFEGDLNQTITNILNQWLEDGTLANIINNEVFNMKADKVDLTNLQDIVNSKFISVKSYGAVGDGITDDTEAIQQCLNENDIVYFPKGTYITSNTLYMDRSRMQLIGAGNHSVSIKKINNKTLTGLADKDGVKYSDIDAIVMAYGYIGDFKIVDLMLESTSNIRSQYGFYSHKTYRFLFEDIYVRNCEEGIRCIQTWNTNIKKVRVINCGYGFRIDSDTPDPMQSTSINFDNTFAESCDFGYKFVNLTYFSGNSMSSDFIKECAYWFHYSSGAINGLGFEASEGQVVRNWLSNISISGAFGLNIKRSVGLRKFAKSLAKFEVWSENRVNTGLILESCEVRSASGTGDSTLFSVTGGSILSTTSCRMGSMESWGIDSSSDSSIMSQSYYASDVTAKKSRLNGVEMNNYQTNYTTENSINHEGVHIRKMSDNKVGSITVPLSDIRKRYPNFMGSDRYANGLYKLSMFTISRAISNLFIYGTHFSREHEINLNSSPAITDVKVEGTDVVITFTEPIGYFDILVTR